MWCLTFCLALVMVDLTFIWPILLDLGGWWNVHFISQDEWILLIRWIYSCDQFRFLFPLSSSCSSLFFPHPSLTNDFSNVQMLVDSSMTLCQMNQHELDWDRSIPPLFLCVVCFRSLILCTKYLTCIDTNIFITRPQIVVTST